MSKIKISDYRNHYPLYPNQFKICIELVGESIKISSDKNIKLKTTQNMNYNRVQTKINYACDMLLDSIGLG